MSDLYLSKTKTTPAIEFNSATGKLIISGESYPENSAEFYKPVFSWLNNYMEVKREIEFSFKLTYFNTSSSKSILDIIELLENYHQTGGKVSLNWYFEEEDDDIEDSGIEFTSDLTLPCKLIPY
ncbi:MAG: DUF1987 domain-containing protein [Desulfobulbaceae bacterium]|nr:DUF1987 domain-containing protein [Candidatus Kapabacteria bacterium]MBS3999294.1 DUF1987 domain-containing protein [Desulfobulbaceae bacterium]